MGSESDTTEQLSLILHFGSSVKSLRAMQARVRPLGWEVPLEKRMAMHSSILAWIIPWTKQPGRLQSVGYQICKSIHIYKSYHPSVFIIYTGLRCCSLTDNDLAHPRVYPLTVLPTKKILKLMF